MSSIDLKKTYPEYSAAREPEIVDVATRPFLMIDGAGDPGTSPQYTESVEALYPIAYGLRAAVKEETGDAYVVMPLEGLWWAEDMAVFGTDDKSDWLWTLMICLPEAVTDEMAAEVLPAVTNRKKLAAGSRVRFESYSEGPSAQVLYLGPYADEAPTIAHLHSFIHDNGYELAGRHHEIYLSDPRKTDATKLRTIIRQPFAEG